MKSSVPRGHKWRRFLERATAATGLSEAELIARLTGAGATSVRANPLHPDGLGPILATLAESWPALEPVPGDPGSFFCSDEAPCFEMVPLADQGKVYLQNASSLLPVLALDPQPGERILDVAAAPGGKAFNIAGKTANRAELWLNDAIKPRLEKLERLAALYHVGYASLTMHKAQYLDKFLPTEYFDRILIDAQCTGEGRFDLRKRGALQHWSEERVRSYTHLQAKMIDVGYRLLAPGGTIVYSTCSISPEENEVPVSTILRRHPDLDVVDAGLGIGEIEPGLTRWLGDPLDPRLARTARVLPSERFEGFFVAALTRRT